MATGNPPADFQEKLSSLHSLSVLVNAVSSIPELVDVAMTRIAAVAAPDVIFFYLKEGDTLVLEGGWHHPEGPGAVALALKPVGACLCGLAAATARPVYSKDIESDPLCTLPECKQAGLKSVAALPLSVNGETFGVLMLASFATRDFEQEDTFLEILTSQISIALQNILYRSRLKGTIDELNNQVNICKVTEEGLRKSEAALRRAQSVARLGSWDWDLGSGAVEWSDELYRIMGIPRQEVISGLIAPLIHPDDRDQVWKKFAAARISGEPFGVDCRSMQQGSGERHIHVEGEVVRDGSGKAVRMFGTVQDITDRRRAERSAENAARYWQATFDASTDGICVLDRDHRIVQCNKAASGILGLPSGSVEGRHCWEFMHGSATPPASCPIMRMAETKKSESEEIRLGGKWLLVSVEPIVDEGGELTGGVFNVRDITERKKLQEQLLHAQKMEAVGQLAGGIAHDFNNILNAIIGFGSIVQMKMRDDDPLLRYINQILESANRAAQLTHSLLAFSRKQAMDLKPVDLNQVIARVEELLKRVIGEDIEVVAKPSPESLVILADSGQIEQILMNLATNARDAMPHGGSLVIGAEPFEIDEEYVKAHGYGEAGRYAVMTVADTGQGMDRETREKIFEPFFTTKEKGKGTGLGLSMVYGLVKQHSGHINVYSEPGKGTTFKLYFPLYKGGSAVRKGPEPAYPKGGAETILVAEDDEVMRKFTRTVLEQFGYKVITAEDGDEAVQKFREHSDEIALCLLDMIMPKRSGKEVYEEIGRIRPDVKTVFVSGYTADLIDRKALPEGHADLMLKPVTPRDLLRKIREMLDAR